PPLPTADKPGRRKSRPPRHDPVKDSCGDQQPFFCVVFFFWSLSPVLPCRACELVPLPQSAETRRWHAGSIHPLLSVARPKPAEAARRRSISCSTKRLRLAVFLDLSSKQIECACVPVPGPDPLSAAVALDFLLKGACFGWSSARSLQPELHLVSRVCAPFDSNHKAANNRAPYFPLCSDRLWHTNYTVLTAALLRRIACLEIVPLPAQAHKGFPTYPIHRSGRPAQPSNPPRFVTAPLGVGRNGS
ncbi:hypothetical protein B0H67DRAFT_505798, partial [Lasiosphaeris hirsuta]